jgi:bifunctional non-homologous end joining protein LigD
VVRRFSEAIVRHLAKTLPTHFVAQSGAPRRVGKIFVDYLRNGQGATTAAAFSARARPGLGVSMPLAWEALDDVGSGAHWTVANAPEHLSRRRLDPWADYAKARQSLTSPMKASVSRPRRPRGDDVAERLDGCLGPFSRFRSRRP